MKIAVVGSLYGQLDRIYEDVRELEQQHGLIDLVIVCGNFQAFRNSNDLACSSAPDELKKLGDFPDYFSCQKKATHLTLVIAGHYEASNYFQTLPYGGWIAPNIYYMGNSNVVKFNGVRIAGISGLSTFGRCLDRTPNADTSSLISPSLRPFQLSSLAQGSI